MIRQLIKKTLIFGSLAIAALLVLAMIAGFTYEKMSRNSAADKFPAPGKFVDIGGRRIQLDCRGAGAPTVVFESGLDIIGSLSWASVHDDIAKVTRTCAYSRAGIMWSDPSNRRQNAKAVAEDLHAALLNAGEKPAYVLVGHSLGGPYIMTFTKYYGKEVAGLVFVDASHPDQLSRTGDTYSAPTKNWRQNISSMTAAPQVTFGIARLHFSPVRGIYNLASTDVFAINAHGPMSMLAVMEEADARVETFAEAGTFRNLGDRPVVVLTATKPLSDLMIARQKLTPTQARKKQEIWKSLHDEMSTWSTQGEHRLISNSEHYIQLERPKVVIDAVLSVIERVRSRP